MMGKEGEREGGRGGSDDNIIQRETERETETLCNTDVKELSFGLNAHFSAEGNKGRKRGGERGKEIKVGER